MWTTVKTKQAAEQSMHQATGTTTSGDTTSDERGGNRQERREQQKHHRQLVRDIEKRNRAQLVPHYVTGGLLTLAGAIHQAAMQAHALGAAALLAGAGIAATGIVGYWWLRRRQRLLTGWNTWHWAVIAAASAWMVYAVAAGVSWGSLTVALSAEAALGARWWRRHRHPAPAETATAEQDVTVDDSLISTYITRWNEYVACQNGVLPDSSLTFAGTFDRGIEYLLHLKRGQQTIDQVRNNLGQISTGMGRQKEHLVVEARDTDEDNDPAQITLRVITSNPIKEHILFEELRYHDGAIPLGPYADGIGEALWRLYTDDSMWGGLVVGATGTGKSRLMEMLALEAMWTGHTYVMHLDGQDGSSCPVLWENAPERYGVDDTDQLLDRLSRMLRRRNRICGGSFEPTPDLPGVLVVVDETNAVLTKDNLKRWLHLVRQGRKCGIAVVMGDQDGSLETFLSSTFRGQLRKGNAVGLKTEESSQGQILGKGKIDLSELPEIPGFGYTLGTAQRRAPYKGRFLMARKDYDRAHRRGQDVPVDLRLIEQWYADAPTVTLDPATDDDTAVHPDPADNGTVVSQAPTAAARPAPLVPMELPTLGTTPEPEPTPAPDTTSEPGGATPDLSDTQYQVLDTVRLGVSQTREIAEQLVLSRQRVGTVLGTLVEHGLVQKTGSGAATRYTPTVGQAAG